MLILTVLLLGLGVFFFVSVVVGIVRFPDFYTRSHAASKGDTLSTLLFLLGFAIYTLHDFSLASALVAIKIMLILIFVWVTSPTASHALIDAGYEVGLMPWTRKDRKKEISKEEAE